MRDDSWQSGYSAEEVQTARDLHAAAETKAAELDEVLIGVATGLHGEMRGLEFHTMQPASIAHKLRRTRRQGVSLAEAVDEMADTVRYTMTFAYEGFEEGVAGALAALIGSGDTLIPGTWSNTFC